jgi:hypothetical protein
MWYSDGLALPLATQKAALRFNEKRQFEDDYPATVLVNPSQTDEMPETITLTIHGKQCVLPVEGEKMINKDHLNLLCEDKRTWQLAMAELLDEGEAAW